MEIEKRIFDFLKSYKLQHWRDVDDEHSHLQLVDLLTPNGDKTIDRGLEELELLSDDLSDLFDRSLLVELGKFDGYDLRKWMMKHQAAMNDETERGFKIALMVINEHFLGVLKGHGTAKS